MSNISAPKSPFRVSALFSTAVILVLIAVVAGESLNLFRRLPEPKDVVGKMEAAASALPAYEARLMVFGGVGSPGDTCNQWRNREGEVITSVKSMLGTRYVERWHGETWEFYHAGLALQGKVTVRNMDRLTCPHWLIGGYPSVQELVAALSTASDITVDGDTVQDGQRTWVLSCRPTALERSGVSFKNQPPLLSQRWRVMVPQSTKLPSQILPLEASQGMAGISVGYIKDASPSVDADWRRLAGPVVVEHTRSYQCDAVKPETITKVVADLRKQFLAYQRSQYPVSDPN